MLLKSFALDSIEVDDYAYNSFSLLDFEDSLVQVDTFFTQFVTSYGKGKLEKSVLVEKTRFSLEKYPEAHHGTYKKQEITTFHRYQVFVPLKESQYGYLFTFVKHDGKYYLYKVG